MNFTWKIVSLQCHPVEEGKQDVVVSADWHCAGESVVSGKTYKAQVYGMNKFALDPTKAFTPYSELEESQIFAWCVAAGLDKKLIEAKILENIQEQVSPPVIQPPLPWVAP